MTDESGAWETDAELEVEAPTSALDAEVSALKAELAALRSEPKASEVPNVHSGRVHQEGGGSGESTKPFKWGDGAPPAHESGGKLRVADIPARNAMGQELTQSEKFQAMLAGQRARAEKGEA